jgi:UDP-N-acetylglucosamine 2-epimerase
MKIISIVGARPQFIKAAFVSKKLKEQGVKEILVHTGQHYDFNLSEVFFKELNLAKPKYNLGIGSGRHGEQTGRMISEIEKVLLQEKPNFVVVYGDTNSTLAGALAAAKLHIPVAHVEAGLRSYNKNMPEEINRVLTDHISEILFAPTDTAVNNLKNEGITKNVYKVGDVMFDIALQTKKIVDEEKIIKRYGLKKKNFILVTIHRAENTDNKENLRNIWLALKAVAKKGIKVFFTVHPRTKKALKKYGFFRDNFPKNLVLNEPVSYFEMVALESNAKVIVTDSGGVQKEGYFFKTPCVITRKETEWTELVDIEWNMLAGSSKDKIITLIQTYYNKTSLKDKWVGFYGNGRASEKIAKMFLKTGHS